MLSSLLAVGGWSTLGAQISASFEEPDLTTPVFEVNRLGIDAAARSQLAVVLAAGVTNYDATLDAKILGIALRLDPGNSQARQAADRRKRGQSADPKRVNPAYSTATVASYLAGSATGLRAKGGVDNLTLSGYLSDIAAQLAPGNPVVRFEKETYAKTNPPPVWAFLKSPAHPAAAGEALLKRQSKIKGLSVSELPGGERTGAVLEIIATAEDGLGGVATSRPVGESMRVSLQEAGRAVKLRHPSFGQGQRLVVSFDDNHVSKDGPSAGAAFTLLLYSLYDPLTLAPDCAITGEITVDGRVRAVGGVPSKLHAALLDGCRVVAIPKENAESVADLPLIYPANMLWKLQIFTVDTLDEALAVMREDRPADLQKAMDLFGAVQRRVGLETARLSAAHADIVPQLREVLRLAPGHASAAAMLKSLEGRDARTLSLNASLDEVERITAATFRAAMGGEGRPPDLTAMADGLNRLEMLRPRLDYRVADLCLAEMAILRSAQQVRAAGPTSGGVKDLREQLAAMEAVKRRMSSDPALMEALRH